MLNLLSLGYQARREASARRRPREPLAAVSGLQPPPRWFHSIDLGGGQMSPGDKPNFVLRGMADIAFRQSVKGKSVLDIGAWDGFYSFEAERRGATHVLATDHFSWSGPGWGTKAGFDYAHARLGSRVESLDIPIHDLNPHAFGTFDVVLFLGVLYHMQNPYIGLQRAAAMSNDLLIVETVTTCNWFPVPVMRFYLGKELDGDPTNYWAPNVKCLRRILRDLGFKTITIAENTFRNPIIPRHFAFASKR